MADQQEKNSREKMNINSVEERYFFAQKEQWIQDIFLGVMFIFLALGILGLFGRGPISKKILSGSNYEVEYHQFLRSDTSTDLYVNLKNPADTTVITFPADYVKQVMIEEVIPTPESVVVGDNRLHYRFITSESGIIAFYLRPEWFGSKELDIGIQGKVTSIKQFVYF